MGNKVTLTLDTRHPREHPSSQWTRADAAYASHTPWQDPPLKSKNIIISIFYKIEN